MNKIASLSAAFLFAFAGAALAFGGGDLRLDPAPVNRLDAASAQRGARIFVNYCMGCHGAKFMRYERLKDIGLTEEQIKANLMFGTDRIGSLMTTAMTPADARNWLGAVPPDLSVEARVRGSDWLYNYFLGYYKDETTPTGWNNLVFPNVGMPHVLWELSGQGRLQETEYESHDKAVAGAIAAKGLAQLEPGKDGKWIVQTIVPDPNAPPGTLSPADYKATVADLVNFLDFVAEPARNQRISLGIAVLMFLVVLWALVYLLKREYAKDVH